MPFFSEYDDNDISADGRFVAFVNEAANLVPGDTNFQADVFVRDRLLGTTERVSVSTSGQEQYGYSYKWFDCHISPDGRFVTFLSDADNLVPGHERHLRRILHDADQDDRAGEPELDGVEVSGGTVSAVSRAVGTSRSRTTTHLVPGDTNDKYDVFCAIDLATSGSVSARTGSRLADSWGCAISPTDASSGSRAAPLASHRRYEQLDASRPGGQTGFTSACDPARREWFMPRPAERTGAKARMRQLGSGGAELSARGGTYLSSDSLVFETHGELPNALSLLLQGTAPITSGVVYGQGVRCIGGTIRRLFVKTAVAGVVVVPDFEAGDATTSARSRAKGDSIHIGEQRWYQVVYRDPIVLGGCPASSTFNATQTGMVSWGP